MSPFLAVRSPEEWKARFGAAGVPTTVSVGNFDGLHLGHRKILEKLVERARATGTLAVVVTFDPHPLKVLRPAQAPPLVETLPQRLAGIEAAGLDAALVLHFDAAFAALRAGEFVRGILVELLRTQTILVGSNFRFGYEQEGDVAMLAELGQHFGFAVELIPPVEIAGQIVSSTAVRRAVLEGRVEDAAQLLGRFFSLTGAIESGGGRGSTLLFPTLNLAPEQELLPKTGVYATEVQIQDPAEPAAQSVVTALPRGRTYGAATNVGFRPTFNGTRLSVESHLFDFSRKITSGWLEVFFRRRLRDERKFAGPDELRRQIASDLDHARDILQHFAPSANQPRK